MSNPETGLVSPHLIQMITQLRHARCSTCRQQKQGWDNSYIVVQQIRSPGQYLTRHSRKISRKILMYSLWNVRRLWTSKVNWHYFGILLARWWGPFPGDIWPEKGPQDCAKHSWSEESEVAQRFPRGNGHGLILLRDKTSTDSSGTVLPMCKRQSSSDTHTAVMIGVWKINTFSKQFP